MSLIEGKIVTWETSGWENTGQDHYGWTNAFQGRVRHAALEKGAFYLLVEPLEVTQTKKHSGKAQPEGEMPSLGSYRTESKEP